MSKPKNLPLIFLLICSISFILSLKLPKHLNPPVTPTPLQSPLPNPAEISFPYAERTREPPNSSETLQVNIDEVSKKYIKIHTSRDYDPVSNMEIAFHSNYPNPSRANAEFFYGQFAGSDVDLYVNAENITENKFFITNSLSTGGSILSYNLSITEQNYIEVGRDSRYLLSISPQKLHSYENPDIIRIPRLFPNKTEEKDAFMTISATGSVLKEKILCFLKYYKFEGAEGEIIPMESFTEGQIATFKESTYPYENYTAYYELTVHGFPGDQIKIDTKSTVLDKPELDNEIIPGAEGMMGYLNVNMTKECYNVKPIVEGLQSTYYINFLIYTGKGLHYLIEEKTGKIIEDSKKMIVKNGVIKLPYDLENHTHTCISLPEGEEEVIYYLQITDFNNQAKQNVFEPQYKGTIYQREIPSKGAAFFSYLGYEAAKNELNYYMKTLEGSPVMYYIKCKVFPNCLFTSDEEVKKAISEGKAEGKLLHGINGYYTYRQPASTQKLSPWNNVQDIMLVHCLSENGKCVFETSFYTSEVAVNLKADSVFYQYLNPKKEAKNPSSQDSESFFMQIESAKENLQKLVVTLTVVSGDIGAALVDQDPPIFKKTADYINGNKRIIEYDPINLESWGKVNGLYISLYAQKPAYYAISYHEVTKTDKPEKQIRDGVSTIEVIPFSKDKKGSKTFNIIPNRISESETFIVGFYALNCKVKVTRLGASGKDVRQYEEYFFQDDIHSDDPAYKETLFQYKVDVLEMDTEIYYEDHPCMVQISSLEMTTKEDEKDTNKEKQLAIPENYQTQFILSKKVQRIKYLYPHMETEGPVIFTIILECDAKIYAEIGFGDQKPKWKYTIGSRQEIIIPGEQIRAKDNICENKFMPCPIYLTLYPDSKSIEKDADFVSVKVMVRSADETPSLLKKTVALQDFTLEGSNQYFYIEVATKEQGEIYVNFNRGSGSVYGRLIPRDRFKDEGIETKNHTWHGRYYLPQSAADNDGAYFDRFSGKLSFSGDRVNETCKHGCYLLITVDSNYTEIESKDSKRIFPISIYYHESTPYITHKYVDIPLNEFVIGSIEVSQDKKAVDFMQYYQFDVEADTEEIEIELESEVADMIIFLRSGGKPLVLKPKGIRTLYTLTAENFGVEKKSLKGELFNFAFTTNDFDSDYVALFGFRVRTHRKDFTEIIRSDTDIPTICKLSKNKYCYYVINVKDLTQTDTIFLHAKPYKKNNLVMYANLVDHDTIDGNDITKYNASLPTKISARWKTEWEFFPGYLKIDLKKSLINEPELKNMYYLVVGVLGDKEGDMELMSQFYKYTGDHLPNPTYPQLYNLQGNESVTITIPTDRKYIMHVSSVFGGGELTYENEEVSYSLIGSSDIISLANQFQSNLKITPLNQGEFSFYVNYESIAEDENYNEVNYGLSNKFELDSIKDDEFPMIFYSKIPEDSYNIPLTFTISFNKMVEYTPSLTAEKATKSTKDYVIQGIITNEKIVIGKKRNKYIAPDLTKGEFGTFDQTLQTGQIHFSVKDIARETEPVKYAYIQVTKAKDNPKNYTSVSADITVLPVGGEELSIAPYGRYIFGQMENKDDHLKYYLAPNKEKTILYEIELARNGQNTNFAICLEDAKDDKKNMTFKKVEQKFGREIIHIQSGKKLKFTTWLNEPEKIKPGLLNYVIKYRTSETENFEEYLLKNEKIEISIKDKEKKNYSLKLQSTQKKMDENSTLPIPAEYYIRFIKASDVPNERYLRSIAFSQSKGQNIYYFETDRDSIQDELNFEMENVELEPETDYFVSVYAIIDDGKGKSFLLYDTAELKSAKGGSGGSGGKSKVAVWVWIVIAVLAVVIIVFVAVFIYLKKQNSDLMEKVNAVSFNQNIEEQGEDLLGTHNRPREREGEIID